MREPEIPLDPAGGHRVRRVCPGRTIRSAWRGPWCRTGRGRRARRCSRSGGCAFAAASLPRGAGAQAVVRFEDRRRALDAGRELERQVHDDGQRRVCRVHPGLRRHAGGPAPRLCDRGQRCGTHGRRGSQRYVRTRPSGKDCRFFAPRRSRDDGDVEAADQGVLRSSGAVPGTSRDAPPADARR